MTRSPSIAATALAAVLVLASFSLLPAPAAASEPVLCKASGSRAAARQQARRLVAEIRAELAAVEDEIREVPFVSGLEAGTLSLDRVRDLLGEQYSIIRSDEGSFTLMAERFTDAASQQMFGAIAAGEAIAFDLLLETAAALGLDEDDLAAYEPEPAGQTYPSRVAWIALHADRAMAGASFLVNFGVFGENMGRVEAALIDEYGFTEAETAFFGFFAEPIPGFEENAVEVIAEGLLLGACPRDVRRSARLLQAYELDFWLSAGE
jgi:hypothetical protein